MFQPKNIPSNSGSNFTPNTTLPNSYGRVRTLKEDFENFKAGKTDPPAAVESAPEAAPIETASPPQIQQQSPQEQMMAPPTTSHPEPLSEIPTNIPLKKVQAAPAPKTEPAPAMPNPFGADNFFHTKSPFSEENNIASPAPVKSVKKGSGKIALIISLLLLLMILGGGFYYWWFFLKAPQNPGNASKVPENNSANQTTPTVKPEDQTMRNWKLNLSSDKIAAKLAIDRYAQSFVAEASENGLIEVKIISEDNQPIAYDKFKELFSFQIPSSLAAGLTNEYSLFLTKEGSLPRMGAAFKLLPSAIDFQSLQTEEPALASDLSSFYLNNASVPTASAYGTSKYKNADIRYFNFPGNPNFSMDYTMVSDNNSKYFVFSTSKVSIRTILDYMSGK